MPIMTDTPDQIRSAYHAEWSTLRASSLNALIIGAPQLTAAAVGMLARGARSPIVRWNPAQWDIPAMVAGTLVIDDVDRLTLVQQERLARWISGPGSGVQVLALVRAPLFAAVEVGRFSASLYYRLNVVMVELRVQADLPTGV
jgi:hypothetical protein